MKFSVTSKTRFYAAILCFIFVIGGAALILYGMLAVDTLEKMIAQHAYFKVNKEALKNISMLSNLLKQFNLGITIVSTTGFVISLIILISSFRTRINKYNRIIERIDVRKAGPFSLNSINFPNEDEFGNLGERLNKLISTLDTFDSMKREKLLISDAKIALMGKLIDLPLAFVTTEYKFGHTNDTFNELFGIKESRENYKINSLFDENFEEIISNTILKGTEVESRNIHISAENQLFRCSIKCTPIFTRNYEVAEVMVIFEEAKKTKK